MRLLAIGDIHGCLTAFDALLAAVDVQPDDWLVVLGDYIDRGPDSCGVLDRLIELSRRGKLIALRGNHEEMMLDSRYDPLLLPLWLQYGGQETLESYERHGHEPSLAGVPEAHWNFLEHCCVNYFESATHFFVHAMADPARDLDNQPPEVLRWLKFSDPGLHRSGKTMVCGHTAQESGVPLNFGHAVCIDTWVYGEGWLTCLDVDTGDLWQANEDGETRTAKLEDFLVKKEEPGKPSV